MSGVRRLPSTEADSLRSKSQYLEHPRRFDDAAKLQLAPLAADVGRAERLHEPSGLGLQRLLRLVQRSQLLGERRSAIPRDRARPAAAWCRPASATPSAAARDLRSPSGARRGRAWRSAGTPTSEVFASARNDWLFWRRASDDSAEKASRSFDSASCSNASLAPAAVRSASSSAPSRARSCWAVESSCLQPRVGGVPRGELAVGLRHRRTGEGPDGDRDHEADARPRPRRGRSRRSPRRDEV